MTSFNEIMGALALTALWANTATILGAAAIDLRRLWRRHRRLGPFIRGTVVQGDGPQGELARHVVDQRGRANPKGPILFHDLASRSTCYGGVIELDAHPGAPPCILPAPAPTSVPPRVWVSSVAQRRAALPQEQTEQTRAHAEATRAQGYLRQVEVTVGAGQEVWLNAHRSNNDTLTLPSDAPLVLSTVSPTRWTWARSIEIVGLGIGILASATTVTVMCLTPPVFTGSVSTLGGFLGLAYFLGVQPIGVAMRLRCRPPDRRLLRGSWKPSTQTSADDLPLRATP